MVHGGSVSIAIATCFLDLINGGDCESDMFLHLLKSLKRKSGMADCEVESSEQYLGPRNSSTNKGPFRTPVSGKAGRAQKVPRITKSSKAGSQTPLSIIGEFYYFHLI